MPPLRFALGPRARSLDANDGGCLNPVIEIASVSIELAADREAVVTLVTGCRSADPLSGGHVAPAGLLAELTSRPGRAVHAWLAWPSRSLTSGATGFGVADCPLGIVALVAAGAVPQPRFSIAWLLVHPEARRRGIATVLVAHAVSHAASLGATRVFAETLASWPAAVGFWRRVGFEQES